MKKDFKTPMTIEEFEICKVPFGWKDEYCDGFAYITPREHGVMMKILVNQLNFETSAKIAPISETSFDELSQLFYDAFVDSVEYFCHTKKQIKSNAKREIANFFKGSRGIPQLELCKIAVIDEKTVGACLISKYKFGFKNEIIFVHPKYQGKNIGSALLSGVLKDLHEFGEKLFWSEHHICNELSANWHRKFGFVEQTDIMTAKFRVNYYIREVFRSERSDNKDELEELKSLLSKAEKEVERLKRIEKEDFQAAWLSWKYDF